MSRSPRRRRSRSPVRNRTARSASPRRQRRSRSRSRYYNYVNSMQLFYFMFHAVMFYAMFTYTAALIFFTPDAPT